MPEDSSPFELLPAEEVARLLPSYSKISFLAQGGMAAVYRGIQTSLERPVAIKILPREFGSDESFRLRFEAEGKAMARLNHPNLVSIFDFGEVEGLLYLVMEFVEGETLYQHAYGKPMVEAEAVDLCLRIADGLAHAHQNGILHRDIKPANILLDHNGIPKLGDFGLAEEGERAVGDDLVFGTPGYTAPEVLANPGCADEQADIFAIGVLLHELLTTQLPAQPYQPPSRLVQSDPRIDAIVAKAIQPNPAQRYANAGELADSLRQLRDQMAAAPRRKLSTGAGARNAATTLKVQPSQAKALLTQAPVNTPSPTPVLATGDETEAASAQARASANTQHPSKGTDFHLIRNLIIIAGLCLAIWGAWTALQQKNDDLAAEEAKQSEKLEREKRKRNAAEARARAEREAAALTQKPPTEQIQPNPFPLPPKVEPAPPNPLTPREQLEELRSALVAGEREKFPSGSLKRSGSHFFFVDEPLTWHEAIEFAEAYGGHLAITPKSDDLRWLSSEIPDGKDVWLGAGAISRSDWSWLLTDVEFELPKPRTSTGTAAMVTSIGILKARHPSEELPFFIQWEDDGNQLGLRDQHLSKIAETLDTPNPVWPPGTLALDDRRYLILARPLSQSEAQTLARQAGGTLAVASDELEASFLNEVTGESGLSPLWLGGTKRNDSWQWLTNEGWDFARWAEGSPENDPDLSGLVITTSGWTNQDPERDASGLIIEWSDDAKDAPPMEESSAGQNSSEVGELKAMAVRLLEKDDESYEKRLKDNIAAQGMAMRQWLRNIPREDSDKYEEIYQRYTDLVDPNSIYLPGPDVIQIPFPEKASEILTRHYQNQLRYDNDREDAAEKIRVAFVRKIEGLISQAKAKGLVTQISELEEELSLAGTHGKEFIAYLGLAKERAQTAVITDPLVGRWTKRVSGKLLTYEFFPNGTFSRGNEQETSTEGFWTREGDRYLFGWADKNNIGTSSAVLQSDGSLKQTVTSTGQEMFFKPLK